MVVPFVGDEQANVSPTVAARREEWDLIYGLIATTEYPDLGIVIVEMV